MISTHRKRPLTKAWGKIVKYCRRKITRSARYTQVAAEFQLSLIVGFVSILAAVALGYFLLFMDFEETATGNPLDANASILSDAEVKAGMAAAGVDLDTLDEFLNDKVPTEFDLDPSELRENDSDIDGLCY